MNTEKRITLIQLLSEELCDTAVEFEKAKRECSYPIYGYTYEYGDITSNNCRTTLKRRITTLRQELLELSKSL